jgi:hypothetical protein
MITVSYDDPSDLPAIRALARQQQALFGNRHVEVTRGRPVVRPYAGTWVTLPRLAEALTAAGLADDDDATKAADQLLMLLRQAPTVIHLEIGDDNIPAAACCKVRAGRARVARAAGRLTTDRGSVTCGSCKATVWYKDPVR